MRVFPGTGLALGLALLVLTDRAEACSAAQPESGVITAPVFEDQTRIERATLDVSCDEARCRFEAHYFLTRATGTRAAIALRGSELVVSSPRQSTSRSVGGWRVAEFSVESREIEAKGSFPMRFSANPCVGPGYLARHRLLGTEGRPRVALLEVLVPERSVPHVVRVKHPLGWEEQTFTFDGSAPSPPANEPLWKRAFREAMFVRDARESGTLSSTEWSSVRGERSFRSLQVWFTREPFPIQHAGPMLAAGYRFDVKRPWFRFGYEMAAPSWLITSVGVESDLRDHAFFVPALELTTGFGHGGGDHDAIYGAGAGVPIEVTGDSRLFGRVFVTASMTSFGLLGSVDYAPETKDLSGNALAAVWF